MVSENPDFMLPFRIPFTRRITRNPLSIDSDGCGDAKESVGRFRQFCGTDNAVGAKQTVAITGMQSPRIGTGNVSFTLGCFGDVHGI